MSKLTTISVAGILPMLKLADTVGEPEVIAAFNALITLRDSQATEIITLKDEKEKAVTKASQLQTKYDELITLSDKTEIVTLTDKAVADRIITRKDADNLIELADGKVEKIKKFLEGKTPNPSIRSAQTSETKPGANDAELIKLRDMSFDQLFEIEGAMAKLKDGDYEAYKTMFLAKHPNAKL